jgi:hypothetical protein
LKTLSSLRKIVLPLAIIMSASMWFYVERVLIPYQVADAAAHNHPRGILSDLYPRWLGTRELLMNHRDPYGDEVTREIQLGYYGRAIDPSRPGDPKDQQRFAYPVYVAFLLAPVAKADFATVRVVFAWMLAVVTAGSVLLWLRVLQWRPSPTITVVLVLLAVDCLPAIQGIKLQQLSLLVAGFIAVSGALITSGYLFLAGIFLALATIKPQLALLPVLWLMLWAFSRWRERQRLVWGFAFTLALLFGGGEYFLPGWFPKFLAGLAAYQRYAGGLSLLDVLATRPGGSLLTLLAILGTAVLCWRMRHLSAQSAEFGVMFAFVLAITALIVPMMAPYNQVVLFPAVFLIVRSGRELWRKNRLSRLVCILAAIIVLWQWAASLGLAMAALFLPAHTVQEGWAIPLWTSIGIPLAILPLIFTAVADVLRNQQATKPPFLAQTVRQST